MPPAPPDAPVGRADGPVGVARRARAARTALPGPVARASARTAPPRAARAAEELPSRNLDRSETRSDALETLLVDLGSQIRRGSAQLSRARADAPRACPTGLAALDARLGGGFPSGRLSEICGPPCSGRTSLATSLLAESLDSGQLVAWLDLADAFDPRSAAEAVVAHGGAPEDLARLLWVRARSEEEVLRSSERLLRTEGFGLILLDRCPISEAALASRLPTRSSPRSHRRSGAPAPAKLRLQDSAWLRLARLAAGTRTALVVLSETPVTGSHAELVLEMQTRQVRFSESPSLLEGLETQARLRRHRGRPDGDVVPLQLESEPSLPAPSTHAFRSDEPGETGTE